MAIAFDTGISASLGHPRAIRPTGRGRGWKEVGYLWIPDQAVPFVRLPVLAPRGRLIPLSPNEYLNLARLKAEAIPPGAVSWLTERPQSIRAKVESALLCQRGAIAFDAAVSNAAGFVSSITQAITVASASDRNIAGSGCSRLSTTTVTGQTYNSVGLSAVSGATHAGGAGPQQIAGFNLVAPATGANNFVTTWNNSDSATVYHAVMAHNGVDQSTPTSGGAGNSALSANGNVTVASAIGDVVLFFGFYNNAVATFTPNGGAVVRTQTGTSRRIGMDEAGAASVTIDGTYSVSDEWVANGWSLKAGGGGGAVTLAARRALLGVGI